MLVRQVELCVGLVVLLSVSGMSADIYIFWSSLIKHIDAIALCWFARFEHMVGPYWPSVWIGWG